MKVAINYEANKESGERVSREERQMEQTLEILTDNHGGGVSGIGSDPKRDLPRQAKIEGSRLRGQVISVGR
jgi:hypothetical protein